MTKPSQPGLLRRVARALGPGLITGAADDDPSGIVTYSMAGAQHGMALLWLAWITWPLMAAVQMMCARIGMVTGMPRLARESGLIEVEVVARVQWGPVSTNHGACPQKVGRAGPGGIKQRNQLPRRRIEGHDLVGHVPPYPAKLI